MSGDRSRSYKQAQAKLLSVVIAHDETGGLVPNLALFAAVQKSALAKKRTSQQGSPMLSGNSGR